MPSAGRAPGTGWRSSGCGGRTASTACPLRARLPPSLAGAIRWQGRALPRRRGGRRVEILHGHLPFFHVAGSGPCGGLQVRQVKHERPLPPPRHQPRRTPPSPSPATGNADPGRWEVPPPSSRRTREPTVLLSAAGDVQHGWNAAPFAAEVPSLSFLQALFLHKQIGKVAGDGLTSCKALWCVLCVLVTCSCPLWTEYVGCFNYIL
jgi:hypothetical protein